MNGFGNEIPSQTVLEGNRLEAPEEPTVSGMNFLGWCTDKVCTADFDLAMPIKADTVLYAKWERKKSCS